MVVTGKHIIGDIQNFSSTETFKAVNPANGKAMEPRFMEATSADVEAAATLAHKAFLSYRFADIGQRREFLYRIADEIEALGQSLVDRATAETALPEARISAETKRTTSQLRLFADTLIKRHWLDLRVDTASPDRKPLAKPEIRSMNIPLGPVAVFGACNFPLAFSVAGGDTASALAAGCPVVF